VTGKVRAVGNKNLGEELKEKSPRSPTRHLPKKKKKKDLGERRWENLQERTRGAVTGNAANVIKVPWEGILGEQPEAH